MKKNGGQVCLALIIACTLVSCSHSYKKDKSSIQKDKPTVSKTENNFIAEFDSGPSNKNSKTLFIDKTKEYGLSFQKAVTLYAVDFDSDGFTDLVTIPSHYGIPNFFKFNPKLKKFEELEYNPFPQRIRASFLNFVDLNNDGVLDVVVSVLNQKTQLSRRPIRFFRGHIKNRKVYYKTKGEILLSDPKPTTSLSIIDFDLDGVLDIYMGNWFSYKKKRVVPVIDYLFKGIGKGTNKGFQYTDQSYLLLNEQKVEDKDSFVNATPTFSVSNCDVDQNGYPDFLTTSTNGHPNKLWLSSFDERIKSVKFTDIGKQSEYAHDKQGELALRGGGHTFFSSCADYNNDGIMDVFLGEMSHSYDSIDRDRSSILTGSKYGSPIFLRTVYSKDTGKAHWNQKDQRAIWIDFNFDGLIDLVVENSGFPPSSRLIMFKQEMDHSFTEVSKIAGVDFINPSGTIYMDVNQDGRPDIISGQTDIRNKQIDSKLYVFENNIPWEGRRSLRIHLKGKRSNAHALGSMIIVYTNHSIRRYWVEYSSGALPSQNEEGIVVGLERSEKIKKVVVRWPYHKNNRVLKHTYKFKNNWKKTKHLILYDDGTLK